MIVVKALSRAQIAWRVAQDIEDGSYVNLGVGIPLAVTSYIPADREVVLHSENGVLGMGPAPAADKVDWNLVNAGKQPVTILPGGSYFHHADSFAMIRGRHIDICVLGAFQVSEKGDLANWTLGNTAMPPAVGGAMDLAVGAKKIFVTMEHCARDGAAKIVRQCTLPLTGVSCVDRIFTDLAVIDVTKKGLLVREVVPGCSFEELCARTDASLTLAEDWRPLRAPELAEAKT